MSLLWQSFSVSGLSDVKVVRGTLFKGFIHKNLLPHLMPFNGENPLSIVNYG